MYYVQLIFITALKCQFNILQILYNSNVNVILFENSNTCVIDVDFGSRSTSKQVFRPNT